MMDLPGNQQSTISSSRMGFIGFVPIDKRNMLYFGNLNRGWSEHEFEWLVRQLFPGVVSVDLFMQQTRSGGKPLNEGFAFVRFSSHAAASMVYRVAAKEDFTLGGKLHPYVKWAEEGSEFGPDVLAKIKVAVIRNLPTNSNEHYLMKLFEPFGEIERVVVSDMGRSPVGFVTFARRSELEVAIKEMNMKVVQGPNGGLASILSVKAATPMEKRPREESESKPPSFNANYVSKNTPSAYSIVRTSIIPPTTDQQEVSYGDPYEAAVPALPGFVKERLLLILRLGIATRSDIDIHTLNSLKELPPTAAISVLDQFMLSGADTEDKGIYLAGLIFKHHIAKQMRNELPRSYDYVRHSAASAITSDYYHPVSTTSRTSIGIPNEPSLTHSPLLGSYSRRLSPSTVDHHHLVSSPYSSYYLSTSSQVRPAHR